MATIRIHQTFLDEDEAKQWMAAYYGSYPTAGYGTRLTLAQGRQSTKALMMAQARGKIVTEMPREWVVAGTRQSSAD